MTFIPEYTDEMQGTDFENFINQWTGHGPSFKEIPLQEFEFNRLWDVYQASSSPITVLQDMDKTAGLYYRPDYDLNPILGEDVIAMKSDLDAHSKYSVGLHELGHSWQYNHPKLQKFINKRLYEDQLEDMILSDPEWNQAYVDSLNLEGDIQKNFTEQWSSLTGETFPVIDRYVRGWQDEVKMQQKVVDNMHNHPAQSLHYHMEGEGMEEQVENSIMSGMMDYIYQNEAELMRHRMDESFKRTSTGDRWEKQADNMNIDDRDYLLQPIHRGDKYTRSKDH